MTLLNLVTGLLLHREKKFYSENFRGVVQKIHRALRMISVQGYLSE